MRFSQLYASKLNANLMSDQTNTNKILKGVSIQSIVTISSGIIEILAFSIMSRLLTQEDFGYYAAVTAITAVFASFSDAGIGAAIVQCKELNQKYLNNAFTLCMFFGLLGTSLLLIFSGPAAQYVANESLKVPLMLISITLFTGTMSSVSFSIMQRKLQFLYMGIIRISALMITSIVSILLAFYGFGYYAIIVKIILYSILCMIVSFMVAKTTFRLSFDFKVYKEIFGFGGWLMASAFFRKIAEQIDRLMMANLFSVQALGMYSRPKEFINTMTGKICDIFDSSIFPVLSRVQDNRERVVESYKRILYYINIVGLLITFSFMFNSELIIRIFLGAQWMNVNLLLIVLSFSGILMINGSIGDIFLRSLALTKQQFYLRILQSIVSIVFILIASKFGVLCIAYAYLLAYSVVVIVKMSYISIKINFGFFKSILLLIKSYKVALIYIPIYILCLLFFQNNLYCNLLKLSIFLLITICAFFIFPNMVGKLYKEEVYYKLSKSLSRLRNTISFSPIKIRIFKKKY